MKLFLSCLSFILSFSICSQIKIDDVGDNWKGKVDSALQLIKKYDLESYNLVIQNCTHITFWIGDFSTTEPPNTILISVKDMNINSLNNIACVIVHEANHLKIFNEKLELDPNKEELFCYVYEYNFINRIPNVEEWLRDYAMNSIITYQLKINK